MNLRVLTAFIAAISLSFASCCGGDVSYDVIVIGASTSGTAAGIQSSRLGARTLVVEQGPWLGGMLTAAGVSATDGNYKLRGGIWGEFRDSLAAHYGGDSALITGWVSNVMFEPSVGNRIFGNMAATEPKLTVWFNSEATAFERKDGMWNVAVMRDGKAVNVTARVMIDATELGDVAKTLGVKYDIGMDSKNDTGEDIAPENANDIIQDLTYAMILRDYGRDVTIEKPEGYDPSAFYCCCINDLCVNPKESDRLWSREKMITYGKLPNGKYMINWPLEGNDCYIDMLEMDRAQRVEAVAKAKNFSLQFLYFLQTELGFNTMSLADDEYPTEDLLPIIPYHRESRRIEGLVRFTLNDITDPYTQAQSLYRTAIGVGDYPVDQHHARYSGWGELPNLYFHAIPSYGLPMGVMIPRAKEGLIVAEKSISVTNIVNGSSRLQPVVLQIGQAAGVIAALSSKGNIPVEKVAVRDVQREILAVGGYLLPYLDRPATDPHFKAMQRIGVTGIIEGRGANIGWENQTWFRADTTISVHELSRGMLKVYPSAKLECASRACDVAISVPLLASMLSAVSQESVEKITADIKTKWTELKLQNYDTTRPLTRLECAVLIDAIANPFSKQVDITGVYIN